VLALALAELAAVAAEETARGRGRLVLLAASLGGVVTAAALGLLRALFP
jgi:hypothetical protein